MIRGVLLALCAVAQPASAYFIRGAKTKDGNGKRLLPETLLYSEAVESGLLDVLSAALHSQHAPSDLEGFDLAAIEKELQPLFAVLPKNEHRLLGHSTVHYALNRYFLGRNGDHIKGLNRADEPWNTTTPALILNSFGPGLAQHLLEDRAPNGFDLRGLSVLVATLQHLVRAEELNQLRDVYTLHGIDPSTGAGEALTTEAFESYMILLPMDINMSFVTLGMLSVPKRSDRSQEVRAIARQAVADRKRPEGTVAGEGNITFLEAAGIVKDIWTRFSTWQATECKAVRSSLLSIEDQGSGRVKLVDFYSGTTDGTFEFKESTDYLRKLGALDESNPHAPRVIIENYMGSAANCITYSHKRYTCCTSPCEALMQQLEKPIGQPMAKPEKLLEVIAALPSENVTALRVISENLTQRLQSIADEHHGQVPLHSRLFAQWMHHAYPRECPYPFKAGDVQHITPDEFQAAGGDAKEHDLEQVISDLKQLEAQPDACRTTGAEDLPWSHEEELVAVHHPSSGTELSKVLRGLFMILALVGMTYQVQKCYNDFQETLPSVVQFKQKRSA